MAAGIKCVLRGSVILVADGLLSISCLEIATNHPSAPARNGKGQGATEGQGTFVILKGHCCSKCSKILRFFLINNIHVPVLGRSYLISHKKYEYFIVKIITR